jgi:hypothetical protein
MQWSLSYEVYCRPPFQETFTYLEYLLPHSQGPITKHCTVPFTSSAHKYIRKGATTINGFKFPVVLKFNFARWSNVLFN